MIVHSISTMLARFTRTILIVSLGTFSLAVAALAAEVTTTESETPVAQQTPEGEKETLRVFIFAGQSNMEGADSHIEDIDNFGPFVGLGQAQADVLFSYCLGRDNKKRSRGWETLKPAANMVGPELSFAREVGRHTNSPIAIIKVAAGGTHLGGDWNPDDPSGFEMYPLALNWVQEALADLEADGRDYRLEGFMWHQGENDMFDDQYRANYGKNLQRFLNCWRRDLNTPNLHFYIGELCTKTIWGMDLRPRMYEISLGQKEVARNDPKADYVATSHIGVEIGRGVGLHYHYGTLGQLEHGVNYAQAYLRNGNSPAKQLVGQRPPRILPSWPYEAGTPVNLFVLAGHRNMEGERAFEQDLVGTPESEQLLRDENRIAFKYSLGGGYLHSTGWEPLGPTGFYSTFGPELSFAHRLLRAQTANVAIAKFTHSGSQIIDWTPEGSVAKSRNLYPQFIDFIRETVKELESKGHPVQISGIFYHVGENDMSWGPFRKAAPERVESLILASRKSLGLPKLRWFVSQQAPTDDERVNKIDVASKMSNTLGGMEHIVHISLTDLPAQPKKLVINTTGILWLGEKLADAYLNDVSPEGQ